MRAEAGVRTLSRPAAQAQRDEPPFEAVACGLIARPHPVAANLLPVGVGGVDAPRLQEPRLADEELPAEREEISALGLERRASLVVAGEPAS